MCEGARAGKGRVEGRTSEAIGGGTFCTRNGVSLVPAARCKRAGQSVVAYRTRENEFLLVLYVPPSVTATVPSSNGGARWLAKVSQLSE